MNRGDDIERIVVAAHALTRIAAVETRNHAPAAQWRTLSILRSEGALRIGGATVDYYSATSATVGFQAGAQQYAHVLIFQTDAALASFRASPGWLAGANAFYAIPQGGMALGADTITAQLPVVAMIFGQAGLMAGASIEGTKYTRIIPSEIPQLGFGGMGLPQMGR